MEFRTIVDLPKTALTVTPASRVLLIGSCFADSIGARMKEALPDGQVCVNPFGVLYNPESIRMALEILLEGSLFFPDAYIFKGRDGLWHSWLHSTHFSAQERIDCKRKIMEAFERASTLLREADILTITLGTNHAYLHRTQGYVVGNCHKELATTFQEQTIDLETICNAWNPLLEALARELPRLKVLFTISPYRYAKYGMHGNQLAKSTLMLSVDRLCAANDNALYFPAYEIVTDELRDYRFFDADMLHPSAQASDYVWQRFREWTFSSETSRQAQTLEKERRRTAHKPIATDKPMAEEPRLF